MDDKSLRDAQRAIHRGEKLEAIRLLAVRPNSIRESDDRVRLELLGMTYHGLGQPFEAADALERASLIGPISDSARIALASSYAQLRRIDLARELYLQLALSRRLSDELMLQVAAGLAAIDLPQLAMQVCEWVTERNETAAQAYYDMGVYSASCGNALYLTEALTRRAIQLDSQNTHYRIGLVSLLTRLQLDEEAMRAFGSISEKQIASVTCVSCLDRTEQLLTRFNKHSLAQACNRRINELRRSSTPASKALNGGFQK